MSSSTPLARVVFPFRPRPPFVSNYPLASRSAGWLRSPAWDVALLGFCWVPFYLWVVFGLGLGGSVYGLDPLGRSQTRDAIATATIVALGCSYIHRHYTLVLVYGDRETFTRRRGAYLLAPLLVVGALLAARFTRDVEWFSAGKLQVSAWLAVLTLSGVWNVWHTVSQRYGILRAYAAKARGGLETRAHARNDRLLIWSAIAALAVALLAWRSETFALHGNARRTLRTLAPLLENPLWPGLVVAGLGAFAVIAGVWFQRERTATVAVRDRLPRTLFLASTFALLGVFLLHGPIVGYLCFGVAHAIEYIAFVHLFIGARRRAHAGTPSIALRVLGGTWPINLTVITALAIAYVVLRSVDRTSTYLVYYFGASLLHFLYDGWIWKVRAPEVRRPLGIT